MGQGNKSYEPKYSNECKRYTFSTQHGKHAMLAIPQKVNPDTEMGEMFSLGIPKLKAICDNIITIKQYVEEHAEEADRCIPLDAHVGKEWKDRD
jgi:hypothetical protein